MSELHYSMRKGSLSATGIEHHRWTSSYPRSGGTLGVAGSDHKLKVDGEVSIELAMNQAEYGHELLVTNWSHHEPLIVPERASSRYTRSETQIASVTPDLVRDFADITSTMYEQLVKRGEWTGPAPRLRSDAAWVQAIDQNGNVVVVQLP